MLGTFAGTTDHWLTFAEHSALPTSFHSKSLSPSRKPQLRLGFLFSACACLIASSPLAMSINPMQRISCCMVKVEDCEGQAIEYEMRALGHLLYEMPRLTHQRPRLKSLCPWPDTARRFVEINPHRPTHYSHPL